jgi:hypothetical protein
MNLFLGSVDERMFEIYSFTICNSLICGILVNKDSTSIVISWVLVDKELDWFNLCTLYETAKEDVIAVEKIFSIVCRFGNKNLARLYVIELLSETIGRIFGCTGERHSLKLLWIFGRK